jgi:DNA-binding transcriptional LysR family regulator
VTGGQNVLDFRELNYIAALVKYQSISKAAESLYISQPTLSKFVQNLEQDFGQPLFKRLGNKFLLTYFGERYYEKAVQILDLQKQMKEELIDIVKKNIGILNVSFPPTRSMYMLPLTLPVFSEKYPFVKMNILEMNSSALETKLLSGETDLAFFNLPIKSKHIAYEVLSVEEILLVVPPHHALAGNGIYQEECRHLWIDIRLFEKEMFILQAEDQRTRQTTDKIFTQTNMNPPHAMVLRNIPASVQLVANGYGVCFVAETHLKYLNLKTEPLYFSVGTPPVKTKFVAAYRRGVYLPTYLTDYIQIVKDFV